MMKTLADRRILVTQAADFMGPTLCEVLAEHGADVVASRAPLSESTAPASIVASAGPIDVLIANLALPAPSTPALEVLDIIRNNKFHTNDYSVFNYIWVDSDHEKIMVAV